MKIFIYLILSVVSMCTHIVMIVGKPYPANPLRGNLFKLNSNASSKLRNIYHNYGMPGSLIKGNQRDQFNQHNTNMRTNYKKQYNGDFTRDATGPERSSYKPYVYEIEAVLFENDTNQEKPVTYGYEMEQEKVNNWKGSNKSFILNESRLMNAAVTGSSNATLKDDEFLSINYTIRIDKNILQILSQVLTDFVQKIFKKTLMGYITDNMNQTMTQLHGNKQKKIKTIFNYTIDLKTDPVNGGLPFTISNGSPNNNNNDHKFNSNNNHNYNNNNKHNYNNLNNNENNENIYGNITKARQSPPFKAQQADIENFFEKFINSKMVSAHQSAEVENKGKENGFVMSYDDFDYDNSNPKRY